ncbi:MAG: alkaline phosphatase family protein [Actinomycetota bacterium]
MEARRSDIWLALGLFAVLLVTAISGLLVRTVWGMAIVGAASVGVLLVLASRRSHEPDIPDHSRRRFLAGAALAGTAVAAGGVVIGDALRRIAAPSPAESVEQMASDLGAETMELVNRGFYPGRSGELQLLVYPYNSANYPPESRSLVPDDPRSSHAAPWMYLERIPLVFHGPGHVVPSRIRDERVTLADLAPTTAEFMSESFPAPDGGVIPAVATHAHPPKVIVTFVIDGGGWNALQQWPNAWPNLRRLMGEGTNFTNAIMGSNPAVTACAHATISTGAFPRTHGISGHFIRYPDGSVAKAYGDDGAADTSTILVPTLAEWWQEQTGNRSWIGEIGYQIWHLGMIGRPPGLAGSKAPAIYYDEDRTQQWQSQNPEYYRLPNVVPPRSTLDTYVASYTGPVEGDQFTPTGGPSVCCSPPIIWYQGDVIEELFDSEAIGQTEATSLLYINYKAPDYAGHIYNMLAEQEAIALAAVDEQLGRLRESLDRRFPGEYVLIVTADHGQCPLVNDVGGVRLDAIQLEDDIQTAFGMPRGVQLIQPDGVRPAEVYLRPDALERCSPDTVTKIAASLRDYTYGENVVQYPGVPRDAIQWDEFNHPEFAAVLPADFLRSIAGRPTARFGPGAFPSTDVAIPPDAPLSAPPGT